MVGEAVIFMDGWQAGVVIKNLCLIITKFTPRLQSGWLFPIEVRL